MHWATLLFASLASAASFTPILPPSYPLAVRNPYLSAWLPGRQAVNLPSAVPQFWAGHNLTWSVMSRVDNETYSLFGIPVPNQGVKPATVVSGEFTATRTSFTLTAADITFTLDFLSPIYLRDYVKQSLPFSYLTVSVSGAKGRTIQIYSDIDNSWTGQFGTDVQSDYIFNQTDVDRPVAYTWWAETNNWEFSEKDDMAQWGKPVFASISAGKSLPVSRAAGDQITIRNDFVVNGCLRNSDRPWAVGSVTAFAHDLGCVPDSASVLYVIGYDRDVDVNYLNEPQEAFYKDEVDDLYDALETFFGMYGDAKDCSSKLDTGLAMAASANAGQEYADIVTLSVRQIFGAMDITRPAKDPDADTRIFMKEISSNGNMNTLDVIFPAFPALYVLAPEWIFGLLNPVMELSGTVNWPAPWAIHDIGWHFPNATGHKDINENGLENMPLEESGNLLILAYAYQKATGNEPYTTNTKYMNLLNEYADYLIANATYPMEQLSTDDFAGKLTNQTHLAIKAAVGLNAWGKLTENSKYSDAGIALAKKLYYDRLGTDANQTHFVLNYGNSSSWFTAFNLYPDVLFGLQTFSKSAIDMESRFYLGNKKGPYGMALDSRLNTSKTDWQLFAGATALGGDQTLGLKVRDMFIQDVHKFVTNGLNDVPFSDWYDVNTGMFSAFRARPVAGGHFSLLAMEGPDQFADV